MEDRKLWEKIDKEIRECTCELIPHKSCDGDGCNFCDGVGFLEGKEFPRHRREGLRNNLLVLFNQQQTELKKELEGKDKRIKELEKELNAMKTAMRGQAGLEEGISHLKSKIKELEKELVNLSDGQKWKDDLLKEFQGKIAELEEELIEMTGQRNELEREKHIAGL